ncbi:MAG TPA: hypothetical protein VKF17_03755, partial [Isosphaeraceae bacterium]|nr:hypothetical protein [Isosphaeraceae bacterium]
MHKSFAFIVVCLAVLAGLLVREPRANAIGLEQATSGEAVVVCLIHPDRQAAAVLRLFEGCAAPHPAAALAAWKRSTRDPDQLGKPLEAVISFFNPEMVREWSVFHEARFQLGFDPETGSGRWRLTVPGDDGTLAALITALRLSGGSNEAPVGNGTIAVNRLGGPGAAVAARSAGGVVLASSRAELDRGLPPGISGPSARLEQVGLRDDSAVPAEDPDSGLVFRIEPGRMTLPARGSVATRRAIELARGLGCRTVVGSLGLVDDQAGLDIVSELDPARPFAPGSAGNLTIDTEWLKWIPAGESVAVASLAAGRGAAYWDGVFALADGVDRADPARANLAPLRTRINLLASAVGARLEADLWPHLRGLTVAWLANPDKPEQSGRAVAVLQMDDDTAARHLVADVLPRLAALRGRANVGTKPGQPQPPDAVRVAAGDSTVTRSLGRPGGRPLDAAARGRTVLLGWGDQALETMFRAAEHPQQSVMPLIGAASAGPARKSLARVGAFWPGRMRLPVKGLDGPTPLVRCLAEGPPIVWTGWNLDGRARDRVRWHDLHGLVRH